MTTTSAPAVPSAATVGSIKARVLASAPEPSGLDAVADVRAMRDEDGAVADAAAARRSRAHGSAPPVRCLAQLPGYRRPTTYPWRAMAWIGARRATMATLAAAGDPISRWSVSGRDADVHATYERMRARGPL